MVGKGNPKNAEQAAPWTSNPGWYLPRGHLKAICLWFFVGTMIEAPKFAELCLSTSLIAIPTCLTSLASSGFIGNHYHDDNDEIPNVGSVDLKLKTVWYSRLSLSMSWGFEMFWAVGGFWSYLVWCNDRLIPTWQAIFFQGIRRWYRIPHYVSGWYSIAQYRDSQKSQFQGLNIIIAVSTPKSMSWGLVSDGWPRVSTCQSLNHWFSLQ